MFTVAHTWGVRTDGVNPCWKVKRYKEVKRERYLTPDELARLGKVLRESNSEPEAVNCIRLLLLTGCRLSEIQKLKWEHVDLGAGVLRLPDSKTGAKLVAIGKAVIEVFKNIPKVKDNPYVITGQIEGQTSHRHAAALASVTQTRGAGQSADSRPAAFFRFRRTPARRGSADDR